MAHYAILNENNIVTDVIVGKDENEPLPDGYSSWEEYYGGKRTSYNTIGNVHLDGGIPFRKNYAGIGYTYDEQFDAFVAPQPFDSWKFDYTTFTWVPPLPKPEYEIGHVWLWSEVNQEWIKYPVS
jgi:hypothetical protein